MNRGIELSKMLGGHQCHIEGVTSLKIPQTRALDLYFIPRYTCLNFHIVNSKHMIM